MIEFLKENAPCYIYDAAQIKERCRILKTEMPAFEFLYSIKTNPFNKVVDGIAQEGFGSDAASANEVFISLENGISPEKIFYSAPGKSKTDIAKCYGKCVLIADSFSEIKHINDEANKVGEIAKIGIRINPNFSMDGDVGVAAKFGIDEEQLAELKSILEEYRNIEINGIHIHVKSQILDGEKLKKYYKNCFELAKRINGEGLVNIEYINFGSGIGTVYEKNDKHLDLYDIYSGIVDIIEENNRELNAKLYIETGRFLVCNAGTYYTRIVDKKVSRENTFLIVQNATNGFLRPTVSSMLQNISKDVVSQEPFYTCENAFEISVLNESKEKEYVNLVGNLCTALDIICNNIELNIAEIDDIVKITNAGSYAYSLSPMLFASHDLPKQYYLKENGEID